MYHDFTFFEIIQRKYIQLQHFLVKLQNVTVGNSIRVKLPTGNMQPSKAIFTTVTIDGMKIKHSKAG